MEEVGQLEQIFPTWDQKSLLALLNANGMSIDRTIEAIFIIEAAKESGQLDEIVDEMDTIPDENHRQMNPAPVSDNEFYRGLRCKLPDDFLRVPGWEAKVVGDRDAQLALMLQNELYSQDLQSIGQRNGGNGRGRGRGHPATSTNGNRPRGGSGANQDIDVIPDLGIMKTLTSVGGMASRLVNRLAAPTVTGSGSSGGRDIGSDDYAVESNAETNPLVLNRDGDDDDEVISFEETNHRSRHVLETESFQRRSSRGGDGSSGKKDS